LFASFGLWKVNQETTADVVYGAIKAGYRLFDGAQDYGNEREAGLGIKRAIDEGLVKREDLFITTKLWNTNHSKEHVNRMAKWQLNEWGLDFFDLYLIHFPVSLEFVDPSENPLPNWKGGADKQLHIVNVPIQETWAEVEKLVDEGVAKNIGVSNFQGALLIDLLRYARIPPAVLQVELHPYLTQESLVALAESFDIVVTAYSSFGPAGWVELGMDKNAQNLLRHDVVANIAKAKDRTPAQVLLRWATQRNIAVIPKSNNIQRLTENLNSLGFDLTAEELKAISGLNANLRLNDPGEIDVRLSIFA
jgi:D-xylose reductase